MTAEHDAMRALVDRIPIDAHWWARCDSENRWSVVWDDTPHLVWSNGDAEWCRDERERLNADPRAGTLLAALRGFVRLEDEHGRALDAVRLARMLAYVTAEPIANAADLALSDLYRVSEQRDTARRDLECTQGAIAAAVTRAQQAESTRDAAQARATACEERARRAEAERDEWRACAEEGARLIKAQHIDSAMAWAAATLYSAAAQAIYVPDPSAGTGDHEREPGRNGE